MTDNLRSVPRTYMMEGDLAPAGCPLTFVHRIKYRMAGTMEQKGKHSAATQSIYPGTEDKPVRDGLAPPHMTLTTTISAGSLGSHDGKSFLAVTQTVF